MHERMLDKQNEPSFEDMLAFCGESAALWQALDQWISDTFQTDRLVRFPYGNDYGWGAKYSRKKKHICDVFAERGAFAALFQMSAKAINTIYDQLGTHARQVWEEKSPCASGGWIEFRVTDAQQLEDLKKIIGAKVCTR